MGGVGGNDIGRGVNFDNFGNPRPPTRRDFITLTYERTGTAPSPIRKNALTCPPLFSYRCHSPCHPHLFLLRPCRTSSPPPLHVTTPQFYHHHSQCSPSGSSSPQEDGTTDKGHGNGEGKTRLVYGEKISRISRETFLQWRATTRNIKAWVLPWRVISGR